MSLLKVRWVHDQLLPTEPVLQTVAFWVDSQTVLTVILNDNAPWDDKKLQRLAVEGIEHIGVVVCGRQIKWLQRFAGGAEVDQRILTADFS